MGGRYDEDGGKEWSDSLFSRTDDTCHTGPSVNFSLSNSSVSSTHKELHKLGSQYDTRLSFRFVSVFLSSGRFAIATDFVNALCCSQIDDTTDS